MNNSNYKLLEPINLIYIESNIIYLILILNKYDKYIGNSVKKKTCA